MKDPGGRKFGRPQNPRASAMALNDDLIEEILPRLPAKSVCRFRCVSKRWRSLLSSPRFIRAHAATAPAAPSAFYLYDPRLRQAELFPLDGGGGGGGEPTLSFIDYKGAPPEPVDSCNGLLLSRLPRGFGWSVCNPTTKDHEVVLPLPTLTQPGITAAHLRLAFDPRRSPHYTILAPADGSKLMYKYSSERRDWSLIGDPRLGSWPCRASVYWNGSFVWSADFNMLAALDVEAEQIRAILLPPPRRVKKFLHLAASGERLHYIRGEDQTLFEVLEMTSVSSGWRVLHRIDLCPVSHLFGPSRHLLEFIRGDDEDRLLLRTPTEILSYHPQECIFTTVCQVDPATDGYKIFPLTHTLSPLNANRIGVWPSRGWVSWKSEHDLLLVRLMVEHSLNGKKTDDGFQPDAWYAMVRTFNQVTRLNYGINHLQDRLLSYKRDHQMVKNILANDGFQWYHSKEVVIASDINWLEICKDNPKALVYKRKRVPFEVLKIICASSENHIGSKVTQNTCQRKRKAYMIGIN